MTDQMRSQARAAGSPHEHDSTTGSVGALEGLRVLDLSHGVAGPFAARLLGDLGADVIKVERPDSGDFARYLEPMTDDGPAAERSLLFQYLNWNKRGITLDLRSDGARPVLRRLIEGSDIVVESFRPGTLDRWGIGVDQLLGWNANLVVTSISNFGQTGPYASYDADDLVFYAMSGIMQISGRVDREPIKHGLRQSLYCAGLNAAYATLVAEAIVSRYGGGEHVDVSINECLASELVGNLPFYAFTGGIQGRNPVVQDPFRGQPLPAGRGYLSVQAGGGAPFETYADFFGREEFRDPLYKTPGGRLKHSEELRTLLRECLADQDAHEVFVRGGEQRLLMGVAQGARELLACPQLEAREFFATVDHPVTGAHRFPARLARLSATPWNVRRPAPCLGEHNQEILGVESQIGEVAKPV